MRKLRWSTPSGIAEYPQDAKHHWKESPEQYRTSDTLAEMGATAAAQAPIGIVADQEEEKIQQALAAGTFRIP
jgi:ABC-type branched-subunit amino acid transport system substrate-binding protein